MTFVATHMNIEKNLGEIPKFSPKKNFDIVNSSEPDKKAAYLKNFR